MSIDLHDCAVIVINLDGSTDRMARMADMLDREGIPHIRCPAIDGRGKSATEFPEYAPWATWLWFGSRMSGGEVGCFLSHKKAVKQFFDTGKRFGLVFEDDALVTEGFAPLLSEILDHLRQPAFADLRVANLGRKLKMPRDARPVADIKGSTTPLHLCVAHDFPIQAHALLWSRPGAERFLTQAQRITGGFDNWLRSDLAVHGGGYCMSTPLVRQVGESVISTDEMYQKLGRQKQRRTFWWRFRAKWRTAYRSRVGQVRAAIERRRGRQVMSK
ncbi:MAG: glycosyltransferase family 25 protein [Pseudomonadota bacterium]